ncbi:GNAT family N-acetyltransferase [Nodosilinea sp. FACHB-131]|uniref:GNAT family N-acetyltransferase n=1 Tax=Cyanophyceae TaxID=3028117 RepID=UPI0016847781|nr:GNAT family N-acetyltransferase [Nodosilinea sp. FACHB-131]MBD1874622.1 GNAT family N-acetyltransferase [Nodosilinea sp. FACHB-131]
MNVEVLPALITEKSIIQRMMELYQYDFSEFENIDLDEHGCFGYLYLDYYWVEADRHPFLVRVDSKLAGFVLVNQYTYLPGSQYSVAEFFILRKYRKYGIGRQVAFHIFDLFCGCWEIHQVHTNSVAQQFWRSVIRAYTENNYAETVMEDTDWTGIVQCFDNTAKLRS